MATSAWRSARSPASRRRDPERHGPDACTGGYSERPTQTSNLGVDVAVETSGSVPALQQAIRATRFGGTVCMISFYGKDAAGLYLGDEFHVNRLTLISARAETLPLRDAPVWDLQRLVELALSWLVSGRIRADGILTPIVAFRRQRRGLSRDRRAPARSRSSWASDFVRVMGWHDGRQGGRVRPALPSPLPNRRPRPHRCGPLPADQRDRLPDRLVVGAVDPALDGERAVVADLLEGAEAGPEIEVAASGLQAVAVGDVDVDEVLPLARMLAAMSTSSIPMWKKSAMTPISGPTSAAMAAPCSSAVDDVGLVAVERLQKERDAGGLRGGSQLAQLGQEEIALQLGAGGQRRQIGQRRHAPELRHDQHPDRAERPREVEALADRLLGRLPLGGIGAEETGNALDRRDRNGRGGERLLDLGRREQERPRVQLDGIQPDRLQPGQLLRQRLPAEPFLPGSKPSFPIRLHRLLYHLDNRSMQQTHHPDHAHGGR